MIDFVASSVLLLALVSVMVMHGLRTARRGAVRFSRLYQAGHSPVLGERPMEMVYWAIYPVGRSLARAGISANIVTFSALGFAAMAGLAFAFGHFGIGAVLTAVSALGDAVDGIVARESGSASGSGDVLDASLDRYGEFAVLSGLAVHFRHDVVLLGLVLSTLLGSFMVSYSSAKAEALKVSVPRGTMRRPERAAYLTLGATLTPLFSHSAQVGLEQALLELPLIAALAIVALLANASAVHRLVCTARAARARTSLEMRLRTEQAAERRRNGPTTDAPSLVR